MTKITLNDLSTISGNEQSAINLINANNATIETASDNTLSRDGTSPNQMLSNLDMNSFRISNCVDAVNLSEPATYRQLQSFFTSAVPGSVPLGSGVAAWLAIPTSVNLATAITDETGSGSLVFGTSPTFTTGITINGFESFGSAPNCGLNDTSSVVGSKTAFFGGETSSTVQIHKLNVLRVGGATVMSRDGKANQSPAPTTEDWLATLLPWTTPNAQLSSLSGPGIWGSIGGSRSSDYRTWSGASNTGLTVGIGGFGINDDTNNNTAWGAYIQANRNSGAGPTWGVEIAFANFGTVPNVDPYTFFPTGYQAALLLESGAGYPQASDARTPTNASSALSIANNGAAFNKGIIIKSTALDTSVGVGTGGVAIETAAGQSWRVLSAAATVGAEMWGTSSGWIMNQPLKFQGGVDAASPTPQITMSAYLDNGGAVSVSHLSLHPSNFGFGVSSGQLNYITAGGSIHAWYTAASLTTVLAFLSSTSFTLAGTVPLVTTPTTVGLLPAAASFKGGRMFVVDSNAASFTAGIGAIVAAGGSLNVPVVSDGTNWRIG